MTIQEMTEAMLAGETLESDNDSFVTAYFDPIDTYNGPYVYRINNDKSRLAGAWFTTDWHIQPKAAPKPKPSPRDRMIGFYVNTPGIVVRFNKGEWEHSRSLGYSGAIADYDWAIMDIHGRIIDGPHKFEVEE